MLFSLRHPAIVSSNDQQREIDRADSRNHVSNKIFVTRYIDDSNVEPLLVGPGNIQLCEAEIDCDLSRLFLGEPIRIGSRERFHQCTFSVIDMTRGRQDEMFLRHLVHAARIASATAASWCGRIVRRSILKRLFAI